MTKEELAAKIWAMANQMRGSIKATEYKDYIIGFLFYKYLSDNEVKFLQDTYHFTDEQIKEHLSSTVKSKRWEQVRNNCHNNIGYMIAYEDLFSTWYDLDTHLTLKTVSEGLDNFNRNINPDETNPQHAALKDILSTLQNGVNKLGETVGLKNIACQNIVKMLNEVPTTNKDGYDVLGYIYEYIVNRFAASSKEDGELYTPHEVSELIAKIVAHNLEGKNKTKYSVYDPTSGSGGLLINIGKEASRYVDKDTIHYYGQEKITETYNLTRMNLIMKNVPAQNIDIRNGDTLGTDWPFNEEIKEALRVDAVVSNPPYSQHWDVESNKDDPRFTYGLAPSGKADYAFLLHCLHHLDTDGVMAIVLPHGVLFRGDTEKDIRTTLCKNNHIDTIIGLPSNLFYATGIPTIIMILRKNRTNEDILFIDGSQSFTKNKKQNILRDCDIKQIYDAYVNRQDIPNFARVVSKEEIEANDYNLNLPRYISAAKEEAPRDFAATMQGTVPSKELEQFNSFWQAFPTLRSQLFTEQGNGYEAFNDVNISDAIKANEDVIQFQTDYATKLQELQMNLAKELQHDSYSLKNMDSSSDVGYVKDIQENIENLILDTMSEIPVVDKYQAYQYFINNWPDIEQDMYNLDSDKYTIARQTEPHYITVKGEDVEHGSEGKVLPYALVGKKYLPDVYAKLQQLEDETARLDSELAELFNTLDDEVKESVGDSKKETFTKGKLDKFIKTVDKDKDEDADLYNTLSTASSLLKQKPTKKKAAATLLDVQEQVQEKLQHLTDEEVDVLLLEKWTKPLLTDLTAMPEKLLTEFAQSLETIKQRYANPLTKLTADLHTTNKQLCNLLANLTADDVTMQAIRILQENLS
jgi:type I restriction enzyme M protein